MGIRAVTHVAVRVPDLRDAEAYYDRLLGAGVAFREAPDPDGRWLTLPEGWTWERAASGGPIARMAVLDAGGLVLALEQVEDASLQGRGPLDHVGLEVSDDELERLRGAINEVGCRLVKDEPARLVFEDRHGVRWEADSARYERPRDMSRGVATGAWWPDPASAD